MWVEERIIVFNSIELKRVESDEENQKNGLGKTHTQNLTTKP